jgi:hypothetical protein
MGALAEPKMPDKYTAVDPDNDAVPPPG